MASTISRTLFAATFIISILSSNFSACAESLWKEAEENAIGQSMVSESKGHQIGDILTILIIENSTATQKATTQNKKTSNFTGRAGTGPLSFLPGMSAGSSGDFQGDGTTTRSGNITAKISAKVTKIFPNGNLLLTGTRKIRINDENQDIEISGIVRTRDIASDNSILSSYLADAEIKYKGNGIVGTSNRPGVVKRISDWIF